MSERNELQTKWTVHAKLASEKLHHKAYIINDNVKLTSKNKMYNINVRMYVCVICKCVIKKWKKEEAYLHSCRGRTHLTEAAFLASFLSEVFL